MKHMNYWARNAVRSTILGVTCVSLLAGCGPRKMALVTYHDINMDFGVVQTVAVMPFANLTNETRAAGRVRDMFMTMFQATGAAYVLPPGEVSRGISRVRIETPSEPTPEEVVALASNVGADAIITGTVLEYGPVRSGTSSANVISISVEMMEGQTGRIVWSAASTRGGITAADRLFGGGGKPMNGVTEAAIKELMSSLFSN
jgi:hypothetical protein